MTFVPDIGYHVLVTELPPGEYVYRFVVDGRWKVSEGDPNLVEDQFGEMSHLLEISQEGLARATPKRFSTAIVALADKQMEDDAGARVVEGESETESEAEEEPEDVVLPRRRGDADYIEDYDDDACGELDLQQDVFEAMKDIAESTDVKDIRSVADTQTSTSQKKKAANKFRRPGGKVLRKVWGILFGDVGNPEPIAPEEETSVMPTRNQKKLGLAQSDGAVKKGLKVWFPNERNFPGGAIKGRKVDETEAREVIDVGDKALKLHQVEDNANTRQMLGKTMFSQGKYDAALALFSLSVKLREDNGLKYSKTTAIAHTDVASAFIHLDDLKNAEKHLKKALAIYAKGTFSGGKAQLGDVHCFLGVIGDMRGDLRSAELAYRHAIELYEKCKSTDGNPNYATALENLKANLKRQKLKPSQQSVRAVIDNSTYQEAASTTQTELRSNVTTSTLDSMSSSMKHHNQPRNAPPPPPRPKPAPKPLEVSRPAPPEPKEEIRQHPRGILKPVNSSEGTDRLGAPLVPEKASKPSVVELEATKRRSKNIRSWKDLADNARASMPKNPPTNETPDDEEDTNQAVGGYEEMCRNWHKDARKLLASGNYGEAIDFYTLAIYTRKRHGPWATRENAETLVECARAQFATKELTESVKTLRDAIGILEKLNNKKHALFLGEVWGNLGSVMDRLGQHGQEALQAHCSGMVTYGQAGMSTDDPKWLKAWKGVCMNLKLNEGAPNAKSRNEVWESIDLQIRGVAPLTKVQNVILRT